MASRSLTTSYHPHSAGRTAPRPAHLQGVGERTGRTEEAVRATSGEHGGHGPHPSLPTSLGKLSLQHPPLLKLPLIPWRTRSPAALQRLAHRNEANQPFYLQRDSRSFPAVGAHSLPWSTAELQASSRGSTIKQIRCPPTFFCKVIEVKMLWTFWMGSKPCNPMHPKRGGLSKACLSLNSLD